MYPLHPVILALQLPPPASSGAEKVKQQRAAARQALLMSARYSGMPIPQLSDLRKDNRGAPLPWDGFYWSISHKPLFVAAVWGKEPIGIDLEPVIPRSPALYKRIISPAEALLSNQEPDFFFRVWTAKEAVLKAAGVGLQGLRKCRITAMPNRTRITVSYQQHSYQVSQLFQQNHWFSLVTTAKQISWHHCLPPQQKQ